VVDIPNIITCANFGEVG